MNYKCVYSLDIISDKTNVRKFVRVEKDSEIEFIPWCNMKISIGIFIGSVSNILYDNTCKRLIIVLDNLYIDSYKQGLDVVVANFVNSGWREVN